MGNNIGYMICPLGLTERQFLIYQKLYERCNFADMKVKYTLSQIRGDIKIVDIPEMTIYKDINKMIKSGFLEVLEKARKGNPPTYRIVTFQELSGKPKVNQEKTKGKPKPSNNEGLKGDEENQRKTKRKLKVNPIKEKENEYINIYSPIYDFWISKNIKKHRCLTNDMKNAIDKALKDYEQEEILEAINNYAAMYNDKNYQWCNYQWGLHEFLLRKDKDGVRQLGLFLNDGSKYMNYLKTVQLREEENIRSKREIADFDEE